MDMMFYYFISHGKKLIEHYDIVSTIMNKLNYSHYLIFYGGDQIDHNSQHIAHINCDDTYEGLPNKIHEISKFLILNPNYSKYSYFCKSDCTSPIKSLIPIIKDYDYYGIITGEKYFSRNYHFNKCSSNNEWNVKSYDGLFVPYCVGACYVLSRKSLSIVANNPNNPQKDIYEDLYVGKKLYNNKIYPKYLDIKKYL